MSLAGAIHGPHAPACAQRRTRQHANGGLRPLLHAPCVIAGRRTGGDLSRARAGAGAAGALGDDAEKAEKKRLWKAAIKVPMYSVGIIPVLVAGAAVFAEVGAAPWLRVAGFVLAAIFVIAWLNLSNDAFDAATGVDKTKRESVVNLTGNKTAVLWAANAFLLTGVGLLGSLISSTGDPRPALMLAAAIACGYVYQGPPFRLSYKGLGEPLCFFAFGPLATPAFYLALLPQTAAAAGAAAAAMAGTAASASAAAVAAAAPIPPMVWALSVLVGITTSIILFCSHFHQIEGDIAAGKRSPLVRLGTERATQVLKAATALAYATVTALSLGARLVPALGMPLTVLPAVLLSLPAAMALLSFADANHRVPAAIAPLKIFATKLHMAFGMSLVLGLATCRMLPL